MIKLTNPYIIPTLLKSPNFFGFANRIASVKKIHHDEITISWLYISLAVFVNDDGEAIDDDISMHALLDNLHAGDQIADDVAIQDITPNSHATLFDGRELKVGTIFCLYTPDGKDGRG